jgi:hypothetical protein
MKEVRFPERQDFLFATELLWDPPSLLSNGVKVLSSG